MNAEDRLYKQVEEISTSIMRAFEALERELSEYIESTDKRINVLEGKIQKMEAFIEVTNKGKPLLEEEELKKTITQPVSSTPIRISERPAVVSSSITNKPPTNLETTIEPPSLTSNNDFQEKPKIIPPISTSTIPPIPRPPSITPTLDKDEESRLFELPERKETIQKRSEGSIASELEEKKKKEQDKDKEELMSALKMIDDL